MNITTKDKKYFLIALFFASIVLANLLGTKITTIFGIRASVAIFVFPILFLITDIIAEVYGMKEARRVVYAGILSLFFVFLAVFVSVNLPSNPTWGNQEAYSLIFESTYRIMLASIIAFSISQYHDVLAFDFWKRKTKGKYLWLRNNASTFVSQFIDTTIFMFIAFYHITAKYDASFIFSLIIPYWTLKVLFALFDTPLCYLGVKWLKSPGLIPIPSFKKK